MPDQKYPRMMLRRQIATSGRRRPGREAAGAKASGQAGQISVAG